MTINQHKYERIDKGQKRDKRKYRPRSQQTGVFLPACPPEQRQEIINQALTGLEAGETTDAIGSRFGIDGSTLRRWLMSDDRADTARSVYFANELTMARDEIRAASDPFTLARAREDFRAISWMAERRNAMRWGQQTHVTIENVTDLGDKLRRARERTIDGSYTDVTPPALPNKEAEKG